MFCRKGVAKNFTKGTEKHLPWSFFLIRMRASGLQLKKRLQHKTQSDTCEFCEIFRNSFFYRTPLEAISGTWSFELEIWIRAINSPNICLKNLFSRIFLETRRKVEKMWSCLFYLNCIFELHWIKQIQSWSTFYFLIRLAQTKITLFIFVNNWVIKENESFLIVESCSCVMCCV